MKLNKILLLFVSLSLPYTLSAELWLPNIFASNMVLQQSTEVKIWGKGDVNQEIVIKPSWQTKKIVTKTGNNGEWHVQIKTPAADYQSHTLEITQQIDKIVYHDILFGEVWLCSGQSNMEMRMCGDYSQPIIGGPQAIANSRNNQVRLFNVTKQFEVEPQTNHSGTWQLASPESVANFSATAYFFGQQLQHILNVPVGLIVSAWGGASIVSFMSQKSLSDLQQYTPPPHKKEIKYPQRTHTVIYNAMVHPIMGYTMKGCIWYQGESDRFTPALYKKLFKSMLTDWRSKWEIGNFPFYFAQIAPFSYGKGNSAFMREAQMECAIENTETYMISLIDIGEENDIHPSEKQTVGVRFASSILSNTYKMKGINATYPTFEKMTVDKGKIEVFFQYGNRGLTTYGQPLNQLEIAGKDSVFYSAKAKINKNKLIVWHDSISNPIAIRYGFTDYTHGTLYNIEGNPVSSFRTDNWDKK